MAGSGKTTFLTALSRTLPDAYIVNLDPACMDPPYEPNLDVRDTIDYSTVMSEYGLGPNGAIVTSLNLYATRFDQVMSLLESKSSTSHIIVDTPGQIEAFTWSSAGQIMTELLASSFPTHLTYVVDTVRCAGPSTFMSNMLYALSMSFRSRLPLQVVFNKCDLADASFLKEWMSDYEAFSGALDSASDSYYDSLTRSLGMSLDQFYSSLEPVQASAALGTGIEEYVGASVRRREEYFSGYLQDVRARREEQKVKREVVARKAREDSMRRLEEDIEKGKGGVAPPPTYVPSFHGPTPPSLPTVPLLSTSYTRLSLGCSGHSTIYPGPSSPSSIPLAIKLGVNSLDTSPWYGASESVLGEALAGVPRAAYYLHTKAGRYPTADGQGCVFDFSKERTRSSVLESLRRLRVEYVDVCFVHDPEFCKGGVDGLKGCVDELLALKAEGKVRHVGVTGYPLGLQRDVILAYPGAFDVSMTYCHCGLFDDSLGPFKEFCKGKGVEVMSASPYGMGLLSGDGPPAWHPAGGDLRERCERVRDECRRRGCDVEGVALGYAMKRGEEGGHVTVVGMRNEREVEFGVERCKAGGLIGDEEKEVAEACRRGGDDGWDGMEEVRKFWEAEQP